MAVASVHAGLTGVFRTKKTDRRLNLTGRANVSLAALAAYVRFALRVPVAVHEVAVGPNPNTG